MNETKNLITAVILSILVILLWDLYNAKNSKNNNLEVNSEQVTKKAKLQEKPNLEVKKQIIAQNIDFENSEISGNINLKSLRLNELFLKKYNLYKDSKEKAKLLTKQNPKENYFIELSWQISNLGSNSSELVWRLISGEKLTPETPIKLIWRSDNGEIEINRTISLDHNYMFKISDLIYPNYNL